MLLTCPAVLLLPGECWKQRERRQRRNRIQREWYRKNIEEARRQSRDRAAVRRRKNIHASRKRYRDWAAKNPDKVRARRVAWVSANKEHIRRYYRRYIAAYRESNVGFRAAGNHRARARLALKGIGSIRGLTKLLGCSPSDLRKHIEALFKPGMSWDNYGYRGWHIDHIKPCASFDLTDPNQREQCFHFSNLQPMWAEDNLSKGAKTLDTSDSNGNGNAATVESHGQLL